MSTTWERRHEALKAIHDAIRSGLTSPPEGKSVDKIEFTYNVDGDIDTIVFKEGAENLFTLTFAYDGDKNLTSITRS
ncbi:MAG: hypothetical protein ACE5KC_00415 [Candidatus Bathyarchaeia archaeon]